MKKSELKTLIRETIEEGGFFDDMDAAADQRRKAKASKKELNYSIKKTVNGTKINVTIDAEFETAQNAKYQADILEKELDTEMRKAIDTWNMKARRI